MSAVRRLTLVPTDGPAAPAAERPVGAVRVALATSDLKRLDAHFGSAARFVIYDVTRDGWSFVEALAFDDVTAETGAHRSDGDDRISPKVEALAGCHLLFCLAIGGPSAARVVAARIHPIKVTTPSPIEEVLERTRAMLAGAPPPWLRRLLTEAGVAPARPSFVDD